MVDDAHQDGQPARRPLTRPPEMGALKRQAAAQALTLRPQLRVIMRLRGLSSEDVALGARLDAETVRLFLDGASINPRWQARLSTWMERVLDVALEATDRPLDSKLTGDQDGPGQ